jgi:hypothetical protein
LLSDCLKIEDIPNSKQGTLSLLSDCLKFDILNFRVIVERLFKKLYILLNSEGTHVIVEGLFGKLGIF